MYNTYFNNVFLEANETQKRYRILMGGAGSGKSVNTAMDFIAKLSLKKYKGCSLLVARSSEGSHLNSTFAELQGAITRLGLEKVWTTKTSPMQMTNIVTGNYILFRGCNDIRAVERLKSLTVPNGKLCWVWIEEATELKAHDFEIIDDRLRGQLDKDLYFQITLTFNPTNAGHWIKSRLWDYKDNNIFKLKTTYLDNKFIGDEYSERMERRRRLDPEGYKVYALGEWGETDGVIFTNYEVADDLDPKKFDKLTMGVDFGFNHASVCLLIGHKDENLYILKEVYAKGKTNSEFIDLIKKGGMPKNVMMYCDSAEPDRIKELRQSGFKAYAVKKGTNSVRQQIEYIRKRKVYIDGKCINSKMELQSYRYKKAATGEYIDEPLEVNDDCIAALRYGIELYRKSRKLVTLDKRLFGL